MRDTKVSMRIIMLLNILSFAPSETKSCNPNWKWSTTILVEKNKTSQLEGHKYTEIHNFLPKYSMWPRGVAQAATWLMLISMWNRSTFFTGKCKKGNKITVRERGLYFIKSELVFWWPKIFYFGNSKEGRGGLNYRWMTFMFQLLLPLPTLDKQADEQSRLPTFVTMYCRKLT